MEMTFKDTFFPSIGFRSTKIDVSRTPLLQCWIGQFFCCFVVLLLKKELIFLESVTRKFDAGYNQAKSIIQKSCNRFRNAKSQRKCRENKKKSS